MNRLTFKYSYNHEDYNISTNKVPMGKIKQIEEKFTRRYGKCVELINQAGGYIEVIILSDFSYDEKRSGLIGILPENFSAELRECLKNHDAS